MNRSSLIAVCLTSLLGLGTYAVVRAQVVTPPPGGLPIVAPVPDERHRIIVTEADTPFYPLMRDAAELEKQDKIESALAIYRRLQSYYKLDPATDALVAQRIASLTRITERPKDQTAQTLGRYQLVCEGGWVYRIDTATGDVCGMPVGAQSWSPIREAGDAAATPQPGTTR